MAVNYRNDHGAASETIEEIRRHGAESESFQADVAEHEQVRSMIEAVVSRFGR
ncbi:MAG TPA: beta-ketoacyl-ACP reductase, partial [Deltaproteobacteria bacterium]|nr:beta-ketoacyl-ACP reductase [Deltaproteobacteria bacterium]